VLKIRDELKGWTVHDIKPVDIHCEVCDIYGESEMSPRFIYRLVAELKTGRQQVKDATRPDRHVTTTTKLYTLDKIRIMLNKDARYTVRDLARLTKLFEHEFMVL
jgi:hypothetical protein